LKLCGAAVPQSDPGKTWTNCQNYRACLLEVAVTDTTSASLASVSLPTIGSFGLEISRNVPPWFSGFMKFNEIWVKFMYKYEQYYILLLTLRATQTFLVVLTYR